MIRLIVAALLLLASNAYAQFHYDTTCVDDPGRPGWKVCNTYWNLGVKPCDDQYPEFRIHYEDIRGAEIPNGARLWIRSVYNSIFGAANGANFNSYIWYRTGWYNTCKAVDWAGSCERKFDPPGMWLDPGDWIGGWLNCSGGIPKSPTMNIIFGYQALAFADHYTVKVPL